jgi:hypothetical protein
MPSTKVRLDLTVQRKFKEAARKMAIEQRRSISGLFEDLIEGKWIGKKSGIRTC